MGGSWGDALLSEQQAVEMGVGIQQKLASQVQPAIERQYQMEAIQSAPVSLTLMAPALLATPFTGGMSAGAAFATNFSITAATTTALVGSDRYYETMLMGGVWEDMSPWDRFSHSFRYGLYEGVGEGVGMGTFGLIGRWAKLGKLSPYLPTGATTTMGRIGMRTLKTGSGIILGAGVAVPEEMAAEWTTGYLQEFDTAIMEGASYSEAHSRGVESGSHGANVGKYSALFFGGGAVVIQNAQAGYTAMFKGEQYNDIAAVTAYDQFLNDQIGIRQKDRILAKRAQLSSDFLNNPTKNDRELLADIEAEMQKIDSKKESTARALDQLGKVNPALAADMLIADSQLQFLENVRIGGGKRDANGRLRDFNGRFLPESGTNPFFDFVNGMSQEQRSQLIQAYNGGGKRIAQINMGMLLYNSERGTKIGVDTFEGVVTDLAADWRGQNFEGVTEVVVELERRPICRDLLPSRRKLLSA